MPVYADEDLIPISALQHHLFCPRQCALIHVDGLWAENALTAEGRVLHERSDTPGHRTRRDAEPRGTTSARGIRTIRAMPLISRRLGLVGKADQVELPVDEHGEVVGSPRPVEHKRGRPKRLDHDRVQLAAQAMCLEEMFDVAITEGELFYNAVRRREQVTIDDQLREVVKHVLDEVRENILKNRVPSVEKQKKCKSCSLLNLCLPGGTGPGRRPRQYLTRSIASSLEEMP